MTLLIAAFRLGDLHQTCSFTVAVREENALILSDVHGHSFLAGGLNSAVKKFPPPPPLVHRSLVGTFSVTTTINSINTINTINTV